MSTELDLEREDNSGDQPFSYRRWRGMFRDPRWDGVQYWRGRWTAEKTASALQLIGEGAPPEKFSEVTGLSSLRISSEDGTHRFVPDLRGLDLARLPKEERRINWTGSPAAKDLSRWHFEGARLTDLNLDGVDLRKANLRKATLRRVNFTNASLLKAHLEDADLRATVLEGTHLGHIRYTEDTFLFRGTVLMETHLEEARYVDPLLKRFAKDQYYLYVLKDRGNKRKRAVLFLWWLLCDYGRSPLLWTLWALMLMLSFAALFFYGLGCDRFVVKNLTCEKFTTMLYYSVVTFTTFGFGDFTPKDSWAAWAVMAEVIVGYVMLGGLISILANIFARRS